MRIRTNNLGVNKRRASAFAAILDGAFHHRQRLERVGAVAALQIKIGKILDQPRNVAAGSLHFNRNADRITVIFQQEKHRQLQIAGGVERFPKFAFAGSAVAKRNVNHFVFVKV